MANEIYNTTWWGNAIDTAITAGTEPDFFGSQMKMLTSQQPELVTNGDFANGTTGWSNGNSGVNTIVNGYLVVTGTGGSYASAKQVFPVVAGRKYIVSGQIARVSGIYEVGIEVNDGAGSGWNIIGTTTTSSDFVNVSEIITVNSGATQLDLRATIFNVTVDNTNSLKLDNVSVKLARAEEVEAIKCLADWIHTTALQDLNN